MAAYRTWDNASIAASRGQAYETNTYHFSIPDYQSWQSELTLNGGLFGDSVKWTSGLFYFTEGAADGALLYMFLPSAGSAPSATKPITITDTRNNRERNSSYAAYAQATWTVIDGTRFTAGVRYTYDERFGHLATENIKTPSNTPLAAGYNSASVTYEGITYNGQIDSCALTTPNLVPLPLASCAIDVSKSYHKPTWTLALDHDLFDGTMVYATMRSGYRSGAINTQATDTAALTLLPEQVLDYEIGVKSDFAVMDMPVRANLAAYETVYHNIQTQQAAINISQATATGGGPCTQAAFTAGNCVGTSSEAIPLNAKAARIYGFEWDVEALPTEWLTLRFAGSYTDAHYTDFTFTLPPVICSPPTAT